MIMSGRIADAEQILNGVPSEGRNAEWYFLKGTVLYRRGWLEEAFNHFSRAVQMDPSNQEYQAAMNQINAQRRGAYGGYNPNMQRAGGCSGCDVCSGLLCADCCCECMGGDCIQAADEWEDWHETYRPHCILWDCDGAQYCDYDAERCASYRNLCVAGIGRNSWNYVGD